MTPVLSILDRGPIQAPMGRNRLHRVNYAAVARFDSESTARGPDSRMA
jgi:hypothetical protein